VTRTERPTRYTTNRWGVGEWVGRWCVVSTVPKRQRLPNHAQGRSGETPVHVRPNRPAVVKVNWGCGGGGVVWPSETRTNAGRPGGELSSSKKGTWW